jgi:hypothetical protein
MGELRLWHGGLTITPSPSLPTIMGQRAFVGLSPMIASQVVGRLGINRAVQERVLSYRLLIDHYGGEASWAS